MDRGTERGREGCTLLAIGDVHLGTRPSRLPAELADWGADPHGLTPEAALGGAVERAIAEEVDAVLFAGDVVESTNARFEALRPLENGVRKLLAAGIRVLGVVGNHDVEALPRLARLLEGFELIGTEGRWEQCIIEARGGRPAVEIVGWSFPSREVRSSPVALLLRSPLPPRQPALPRLGLLHADLGASGGAYAPVSSRELDDAALDGWLLGHIHKPSLAPPPRARAAGPRGYLGSLVGLDPTETGRHGPWLIRVDAAGHIETQHLPLAPLRWEQLDIRVGETEEAEDLADRLPDEAERLVRDIQRRGCTPRALGVRVRLVGPTQHFEAIRRHIAQGTWRAISRTVGDTVVFLDKLIDALELAVDLDEVARGDDPPALLARKLIALQRGDAAGRAILDAARIELRSQAFDPRWAPLREMRDSEEPLSDDRLRSHLLGAGTAALHSLLAQRADDTGGPP